MIEAKVTQHTIPTSKFCGSDALGSLRHNLPQACRKTSTTLGNNRIVECFFLISIYFLLLVCTILFQKQYLIQGSSYLFHGKEKKCRYPNILDIYLCRQPINKFCLKVRRTRLRDFGFFCKTEIGSWCPTTSD